MLLLTILLSFNLFPEDRVYRAGLPYVPNLMYRNEDGSIGGYSIEMTQALADDQGIILEWVDGSWPELFQALKDGEIDLLPSTMITPERLEYLDYLDDPLYIQWGELYVHPKSGFQDIEDLTNNNIALVQNDNNGRGFLDYIEGFQIPFEVHFYDGFPEAIDSVQNGMNYGTVGPSGGLGSDSFSGLEPTGIIFNPASISIAFPKGMNGELRAALSQSLKEMKQNPQSDYYRLLQEYRVGEHGSGRVEYIPRWAQIALLITGLSITIALSFVYLLKRQVNSKSRQLIQKQNQLTQALETARMGYWRWFPETHSFVWSNELFQLFGIPETNRPFSLKDIKHVLTKEELLYLEEQLLAMDPHDEYFHWEQCIKLDEKQKMCLEWRGNIRHDQDVTFFEGMCIDITLRKKQEQELAQKEDWLRQHEKLNTIGELAGGIAHDFNNMLTAISGFTELLLRQPGSEENREYAEQVLESCDEAKALTQQLLIYARRGEIQLKDLDIHEIILWVHSLMQRTMKKNIQFDLDLKSPFSVVRGDENQLKNALMNLSLNARDAMPHGGILTIGTLLVNLDTKYCKSSPFEIEPGRYIEIQVKDSGIGIEEDRLEKVFDPFFTTKPRGKGTGLGLASTYGTVVKHSGAITLQSKLGGGTTFFILLPLSYTVEY